MSDGPLKLRALDIEDLATLGHLVEGARVRVADMIYERKLRRFALALTRPEGKPAGLHFENVLKVASRHIDRAAADAVLDLRAIGCEPGADAGAAIFLAFSGGSIRLDVECIEAYLADLPAVETP